MASQKSSDPCIVGLLQSLLGREPKPVWKATVHTQKQPRREDTPPGLQYTDEWSNPS
jgi:hypothetical protein